MNKIDAAMLIVVIVVTMSIIAEMAKHPEPRENLKSVFSAAPSDFIVEWQLTYDGIIHKEYEITITNSSKNTMNPSLEAVFNQTSFDTSRLKNVNFYELTSDGWVSLQKQSLSSTQQTFRAGYERIHLKSGETKTFKLEFDAPLQEIHGGWSSSGKWSLFDGETEVLDPWWSDTYSRRQTIEISGNHPDNCQIPITVTYDGDMNANFDDLRFLENEDSGELAYYIEPDNVVASTKADIFVYRLDNGGVDALDNTIYMYYGAAVSAGSNENTAFYLFDNFNGGSTDAEKWIENVDNGTITYSENEVIFTNTGAGAALLISKNTFPSPVWVEGSVVDVHWFGLEISNGDGVSLPAGMLYQGYTYRHGSTVSNFYKAINDTDSTLIASGAVPTVGMWRFTWSADYQFAETPSENKAIADDTYTPNQFVYIAVGKTSGIENSVMDWVRVRSYLVTEPTITFGPEANVAGLDIVVENIAADNILIDRDIDNADFGTIAGTTLQVDVEFDQDQDRYVFKENVHFAIMDATDTLVDNMTATDNTELTDNTQRFTVVFTSDNYSLADAALGNFDVTVTVFDNNSNDNALSSSNLFVVDDLTTTPTVENLTGHQAKVTGTASRVSGVALPALSAAYLVDNNAGTQTAGLTGNDWENTFIPGNSGQFYLSLDAENLDGKPDNTSYEFPDFPPEIISADVSDILIDRDIDYAGSGADVNTVITVRIRDNDNDSPIEARIAVRDAADTVIENKDVLSTATYAADNQWDVTMIYTSTDNTLEDSQLGGWDILGYTADNWLNTTEVDNWALAVFIVDDMTSTITFDPSNPYIGWNLNVSGAHSRVTAGSVSTDASWLIDNKHGQFSLGAENSYDYTYAITEAVLDENVEVALRVLDSPLDGVTISSYIVNENAVYQIEVRYEENYENVQWIPDENRPLELLFEWDGGTYAYTMTDNPENIFVPSDAVKIIKLTDNDAYWRYIIPEHLGGPLVFVIVEDSTIVEQYRFFLQDYTTQYSPPNGQMLIRSWIGENLAEVNDDYWNADWRMTAWLVTGTQYQLWVRAENAPLRLVGPIDAVVPSEEKTIVVQIVLSDLISIGEDVYWSAWRVDNSIIRVEYQDNLDNTMEAHVGIYDMDNNLMSEYQPDNEWFIVTWTGAEDNEGYNVVLNIQHGTYGNLAFSMPVGLAYGPPGLPSPDGGSVTEQLNMPVAFATIASAILAVCMGLLFDQPNAHLSVLAMALTAIFMWIMGWFILPGPWNGVYTAVLLLVMAVLFALVWRRRG